MIYFAVALCSWVLMLYWFIAGAIFEKVRSDLLKMGGWERVQVGLLAVTFWPVGVLVGLFLDCHPRFTPQSWRDWALIPWWWLRYAWCYTEAWRLGLGLKVKYRGLRKTKPREYRWKTQPGHGRHTDPQPVQCPVCLWAGPVRWLRHGYASDGMDDVEPCDYCPRCGEEL